MNWEQKIKQLEKQGRAKKSKRIGRPKAQADYLKIVLYGVDWDLNSILSMAISNRNAYNAQKRALEASICLQLGNTPKINYRGLYRFLWLCPNKRKDPDNIAAASKVVFDALQKAGVIENDGWEQVREIQHRYQVDKEDPRLELEIIGIF